MGNGAYNCSCKGILRNEINNAVDIYKVPSTGGVIPTWIVPFISYPTTRTDYYVHVLQNISSGPEAMELTNGSRVTSNPTFLSSGVNCQTVWAGRTLCYQCRPSAVTAPLTRQKTNHRGRAQTTTVRGNNSSGVPLSSSRPRTAHKVGLCPKVFGTTTTHKSFQ